MTETTEPAEAPKTPEPPSPAPLPIKYGSFNSRVIAACVDIFIVMTFAKPITDWVLDATLAPMDLSPFTSLINDQELTQNPLQLFAALFKMASQQHLFFRAFLDNAMQVALLAAYTLPFWMYYASTPGKMLLRMEIHDAATNEKLTRKEAIIRFLAYIISFIPLSLGFVWITVDKKCRGWHDMMAHTIVVVKPKKLPVPK